MTFLIPDIDLGTSVEATILTIEEGNQVEAGPKSETCVILTAGQLGSEVRSSTMNPPTSKWNL